MTLAQLVAGLRLSVSEGRCVEDWGAIVGVQDALSLQRDGVPDDYDGLAGAIGYSDLESLLAENDVTPWLPPPQDAAGQPEMSEPRVIRGLAVAGLIRVLS